MAYKRKSRKVGNVTITETWSDKGGRRTTYTRRGGSGKYRQTDSYSIGTGGQRRSQSRTIDGWTTRTHQKLDRKSRSRNSDDFSKLFKLLFGSNKSKKSKVKAKATTYREYNEPSKSWAETWAEIKSIFKPVVESDTIKEVKQDLIEVKQEVAETIKKTSVQIIKDFKGNVIWEAPERKKMATWKKILIWIVIIKIITLIFA